MRRGQTHEAGNLTNVGVAVVSDRMPDRRFVVECLDECEDPFVLTFAQEHAEAREHILIFSVAVARAGFGRHRDDVTDHPRNWAFRCWMQPGYDRPDELAVR